MATALSLIKRSMRLMTVLQPDREPTTAEANDGLEVLNSMMDGWGTERLMVYQIGQQSYSWPTDTVSRTIGPGGNFNTTRPLKVHSEGNFVRDGSTNIDYPLFWLGDRDSYDRILLKTTTSSYPQWLFVDTGYPLMTLYVWPEPTQGSLTLYLNTWTALQHFDTLTETLALPPGYERAIALNLAVEWAPEFGTAAKISPDTRRLAAVAKENLMAVNSQDLVARIDPGVLGQGQPYNIYTDGPAVSQGS